MIGLSMVWGIIILLIFVSIIFKRRDYILLQPIKLDEKGIYGGIYQKDHNPLPASGIRFISWEKINRMELFSYPDMDAMTMDRHSGIRLLSNDGKLVIYDHIREYEELLEIIKSRLSSTKRN